MQKEKREPKKERVERDEEGYEEAGMSKEYTGDRVEEIEDQGNQLLIVERIIETK